LRGQAGEGRIGHRTRQRRGGDRRPCGC
jgi:hypothetical protein